MAWLWLPLARTEHQSEAHPIVPNVTSTQTLRHVEGCVEGCVEQTVRFQTLNPNALQERVAHLLFTVHAFQSLENAHVREQVRL